MSINSEFVGSSGAVLEKDRFYPGGERFREAALHRVEFPIGEYVAAIKQTLGTAVTEGLLDIELVPQVAEPFLAALEIRQ